ncbi:MAG: hypothetical protein MR278_01790 [Bacteroidales bacterium]|nr:hypothetical protein [Anaerotignum sp.]MCI5678707.1 hypothetical protein [Bacteroidales bacterium]MDY3925933.1 hypothetical protein [Anaerotignum sp.]
MKSIMQNEKACYITGDTYNLHQHHIFHGTCNKKISEKYGFWCYLRGDYHNQSAYGVHGRDGHALNFQLKQECQRKFEETFIAQSAEPQAIAEALAREEFMRIIGRNYLD